MFVYQKSLQYPVKIKNTNPKLASCIITQYGGPNGELGAALRYLSQRFIMPDDVTKGLLTDIGTEELGHLEMVGSIVNQLSNGTMAKDWDKMNSAEYYADNGASVSPQSAQGSPFTAASVAVTGDPLTNLYEDLAAEQKARAVYDNILRLSDDPDVNDAIKFLRQREIIHFQRFGEALNTLQDKLRHKNVMGTGIKKD
ncbi:MAG: manganese catalase family protein [Clostridia bacterium]|nr:manganese catalase family protein [Clostridia bacterium]